MLNAGKKWLGAAVAAAILAGAGSAAEASLMLDLRFTGGSKTKELTVADVGVGQTIEIWALSQGAGAGDDGLQSAIAAVKSQIITAGITGSITSAARSTGWTGSGSQNGQASNLTVDGIGDWGSTTNTGLTLGAAYFRSRTTKSTNNQIDWGDANSPASSVFNNLANGGAEFLIGTVVFTPTAVGDNAQLDYVPDKPAGGTIGPATWWEDTANNAAASPTGGKTVSTGTYGIVSGVSFTSVPEPASIGMLAVGGLAALRRRRGDR